MSIDSSWWNNVPKILEDSDDLLREYILNPQIPIHDPDLYLLERKPNIDRLYYAPTVPLSGSSTLMPHRHPETGTIIDFTEAQILNPDNTAKNSMSLRRAPAPPEEAIRGLTLNYPFWPGGFDEPIIEIESIKVDDSTFENDLLTIPPGFTTGLTFDNFIKNENDKENINNNVRTDNIIPNELDDVNAEQRSMTVDLLTIIEKEHDILGLWNTEVDKNSDGNINDNKKSIFDSSKNDNIIDNDDTIWDTHNNKPILKISNANTNVVTKLEWAESVDISTPVKNFDKIIPQPAHTYPFQLDTFQQQAIIKLEEHNHVFVAAHTSAGKTVVAEYAVALSKKHMTRTIYTSPIKALSNQKYRDFKKVFKDVGLITGDIQIDSTSSCLIMTTEILRSMLYCGSEVTRDLEYVIFDEVHYITDVNRGHVWEEVLILLPDHVNIVMLSATVPNTLEFANWVGRTKKRKVFVISTLKRPVPLVHYLYTGCGGKSKNDMFLLVNENGDFSLKGYRDAITSKEKDTSKGKAGTNSNSSSNYGSNAPMRAKQEQQLWIGLLDHLKQNDKLPIVAFTLSRKRCDANLRALQSCDLCTAKETHYIHGFFQKCLMKLKPEDRNIPQVLLLQDSLKRGIGVHHSGILPILKEIIEMLFQSGYVKLLFATETFAMGVNMPARTVIFDSHRKFDGTEPRTLRPAEYTQMAGRAGRRGLDKNGTVILLCKNKVPSEMDLRHMILGKPMRLESKFRLTYAMILNLLRVESVSVEDMMTHSFKEFGSQKLMAQNTEQLKIAEEKISTMQEIGDHMKPLSEFYDIAFNFITEWNYFMNDGMCQQKLVKELKPGKLLIITFEHHYNKLGILLSISTAKKEPFYRVLVLDNVITSSTDNNEVKLTLASDDNKKLLQYKINSNINLDRGILWHKMLSLTPQNRYFYPQGIGGHTILNVTSVNILEITKTIIKIEPEKIIQNWEQRQIPRFKDSPAGATVIKIVTDLYNLNSSVISGKEKLQFINVKKEFKLNVGLKKMDKLKNKLDKIAPHTNVSNFEHEFAIVYDRKQLELRREDLKYKISKESLSLYPDYLNKLQVLQALNYIDAQHEVTMKGRVACEMGSNELIITELVLCNTFNDLEPAEIAVLLSSLVFQAKTEAEPKVTDCLKKCIAAIKAVDKDISTVEKTFNALSHDESKERLNFGLVEVVYEWAQNKPFAEIMKITEEIQEGIVVRCIQQLNETIHDVKDAARIIGNPALQKKMEDASNAIQRDIVFAASLYFDT